MLYFSLNPKEKQLVDVLNLLDSKLNFILQLGYFKAKSMFFVFDFDIVKDDAQHILRQHFPGVDKLPNGDIPKTTRADIQKKILRLSEYHICDRDTKVYLQKKALQVAKVCTKPIYIFKELVNYLESKRIVLPGYSFMQEEVVGKALTNERSRLESAIRKRITPEIEEILRRLLKANDDLYALTILKKLPKDIATRKCRLK